MAKLVTIQFEHDDDAEGFLARMREGYLMAVWGYDREGRWVPSVPEHPKGKDYRGWIFGVATVVEEQPRMVGDRPDY